MLKRLFRIYLNRKRKKAHRGQFLTDRFDDCRSDDFDSSESER